MSVNHEGIIAILSSPSGAGKTSLVKEISSKNNFSISISHTTRKPRSNEINGVDYFFVKQEEFKKLISKKKFLEFNEKMNAKLSINLKKKVIDDIFFCPHHPSKAIGMYKLKCKCRKPGNKLIEDAIKKWKINRKKSVMIGDKFSDYLAAKRSKIKFYYKENSNFHDQVKKIINEKSY